MLELRRRLREDPASLAFAPLAEEYRRAGRLEDAIRTCRTGLALHPGYASARATLGRALLDSGDDDGALAELTMVLQHAPEHLGAVRGVADILFRRGALEASLDHYRRALSLARGDEELAARIAEIESALAAGATRDTPAGVASGGPAGDSRDSSGRAVVRLEAFLARIRDDRARRAAGV
jgi:tetratricopeptide (TPR) repeat protein